VPLNALGLVRALLKERPRSTWHKQRQIHTHTHQHTHTNTCIYALFERGSRGRLLGTCRWITRYRKPLPYERRKQHEKCV